MRIGMVVAAITLGVGVGLVPRMALASCPEFPPLDEHVAQAEVVFVGTVTAVTDEKRTALIEVEEIWRGPELPGQVTIHGGFEELGFTSADRYFEEGTRYLFAPSFADGRLEDSSCTATRAWSDELEQLRPPSVTTPKLTTSNADGGDDGPPLLPVGAALAIALIVGATIVAFRSRSS